MGNGALPGGLLTGEGRKQVTVGVRARVRPHTDSRIVGLHTASRRRETDVLKLWLDCCQAAIES